MTTKSAPPQKILKSVSLEMRSPAFWASKSMLLTGIFIDHKTGFFLEHLKMSVVVIVVIFVFFLLIPFLLMDVT